MARKVLTKKIAIPQELTRPRGTCVLLHMHLLLITSYSCAYALVFIVTLHNRLLLSLFFNGLSHQLDKQCCQWLYHKPTTIVSQLAHYGGGHL